MAELSELLARAGEGSLSFGLVIEGELVAFVSDASRSYLGSRPFAYAGQHVSYEGLNADGIVIEESVDFLRGEIKAGGLSLIVNDTDQEVATRIFGSRRPSRRTFLGSSIDDNDTVVPAVSTEGWPSAGFIHIGRECIRYTSKTTNSFQGCTRGFASSIACAHNLSQPGLYDIGITDTPVALIERRAQLWMWIDDQASNDGTVIWRGVVKGIESTQGLTGYAINLVHTSALFDQEFGSKLRPFGLRGYYFSSDAPATLLIEEKSDNTISTTAAFAFSLDLVGFYETAEEIRDAITNALNDSSYWTELASGSNSLPENADYTCVLYDGHLAIQYRTGTDAKWVQIVDYHPVLFGVAEGHRLFGTTRDVATGVRTRVYVEDDTTYVTHPNGAGAPPQAYTEIALLSTRGAGVETPDFPPNRVYYRGELDDVTAIESSSPAIRLEVTAHEETERYLEVSYISRAHAAALVFGDALSHDGRLRLTSTDDASVMFSPFLNFGTLRWDELFARLVSATPTTGASGETPWLPAAEFNTADMTTQTLAAGGGEFLKTWEIRKPTKLRDLFGPEWQILGLCPVSVFGGTITVRRIEVTTASTTVAAEASDSADDVYDRRIAADVGITESRDGIVNSAEVRFGYDAKADSYADVHISARVNDSIQHYGEHVLTIEPIGEEVPTTDVLLAALRDSLRALALVATHSFPYAHATLFQVPGLGLAAVTCGDIVSITDQRIPFAGRRGITQRRGQLTARALRLTGTGAPSVDLTVRLSEANAGGYAPCARVYHDTPLGVSNTRIRMRAENWDSDAPPSGTRYDYANLRARDKVTIHQEDTATAATQDVVITRIDTANHYIFVDPPVTLSMNDAGTIWVVKFSAYDTADHDPSDAPAQRDFCYIADSNRTLGTAGDPAKVYAA